MAEPVKKQYTVSELATLYKEQMAVEMPDSSAILFEGKTDEEIVYNMMGVDKGNPMIIPASTTPDGSQVPDNIEVKKNGVQKIAENASTDIDPSLNSNIQNPTNTVADAEIKLDYQNYLNPDSEVDSLLLDELDSSYTKTIVNQDNQVIDLKTKNVYKKEEDGTLTKTYQLSDKDFGQVQASIDSGSIVPENNTEFNSTVSDSIEEEDTRENFESDDKREKLVAKNEEIIRTKVDSLIKDGDGFMPVTLAKSAATQFESAYDELETNGIKLQIADSKRGHESQMLAHQNWVQQGKKGPVIAHPDMSFHTIGYAIDVAQNEEMKNNIDTISEVMRRHGWRQHPDEWWHFSLNNLPERRKTQEQIDEDKQTIETAQSLNQTDEDFDRNFILSIPEGSINAWQNQDRKYRIIRDIGYGGARDLFMQELTPNFLAFTNNWNESDWGDYSKAMTWVESSIPPQDLAEARNSIIADAMAEWADEDEKLALQTWGRQNYGHFMSQSKRGMGNVAWDRVFSTAVDQSMTGIIIAGVNGHEQFLVSNTYQTLEEMGLVPEMNFQEQAISAALSMMMPADALTFGGGGKIASWAYKKAIRKSIMSKARSSLLSQGYRLGKGPGKVNLNKVISAVLKPGLGNAIASSSAGFSLYDGQIEGYTRLFRDATMKPAMGDDGNYIMDAEGNPVMVLDESSDAWAVLGAALDGFLTGSILAVGGVAIRTPVSQRIQDKLGRTKAYNQISEALDPRFIHWLSQKSGNLTGTMISEYPLFTFKSYAEARGHALDQARLNLNSRGISNPTDEQVREEANLDQVLRDQAINTAGFLFVLKQLHAVAPTLSKEIQTRTAKKAVIENWVNRVEKELSKDPETDIGDLVIRITREEGINPDAVNIADIVSNHFITQPSKAGRLIMSESLKKKFPEYRIRELADRLKLDPKLSYEELIEKIFILENQRMYDSIEKSVQREEVNNVADRENLTQREVENIEQKAYNTVKNIDGEKPAKRGEQLALDLTEKGFTAEEAISKVNKLEKRVIEDLKTEKDLNDLTVKPKTKKKTRKQRKKHKKKDAGGEKNLQDKINKVKTLVKSAKEKIVKTAEKAGKSVEEVTEKAEPVEKQVKGVADLKKPYGAKPLGEKELFENEAEFQAWKDNLSTSAPHMQLSILYKPVKAGKHKGKIHAQAFEKEITKKVLRSGVSKTISLANRQRYEEDKRIQELRYRRSAFDLSPNKILRDPGKNPQEKLNRYINLHEQVELLEGRLVRDLDTNQIIERTGQHAIVEAHRLSEIADKTAGLKTPSMKTKQLENAIKEYDRVIEACWREIRFLQPDATLSKMIEEKLGYLAKREGGFLDWSKREEGRFSKTELDRLQEDLARDIKEYAVRYFQNSNKSIQEMSASNMADVLSKEFGLPKNTIRKFAIQPENWKQIRDAIVEYQATRIRQAIDDKKIDNSELVHDYLEDHIQLSQIGPTRTITKEDGTKEKVFEGESVILDTFKDPLIAKELFADLNRLQSNPLDMTVDVREIQKFSQLIKQVDGKVRDDYQNLYDKIANRDNDSRVHEIVSHLPHLFIVSKWMRDNALLTLRDSKTPEEFQHNMKIFMNHDAAKNYILNRSARTLKAASEAHNIIEDGQVMKDIFNRAGIYYTEETAEMLRRDLSRLQTTPTEEVLSGRIAEKTAGILAEINRNMLLASFAAGTKAVAGNTLSSAMNRVSEGPRNLVYKNQKRVHHKKLEQIDNTYEKNIEDGMPKAKAKKLWQEQRDEQFAAYHNRAGLSWEWYTQEGYRSAYRETFNRQAREFMAIMRETPTKYDEAGNVISSGVDKLNPNYGKEYSKQVAIPTFIGKVVRSPQNLMGALDNIVRMPMLMGEFERLVYNEAVHNWKAEFGDGIRLPDPANAKHIEQMNSLVASFREDMNNPRYKALWESANTYASKIVFQDAFYWDSMKKLNDMRIASGKTPWARAGGHLMNIVMPFVLTGVNALKMAYEYNPMSAVLPGPGFLSFWGDVDYATSNSKWRNRIKKMRGKEGQMGKTLFDVEGTSHLARRLSEIPGGKAMAEKELYTMATKKLIGAMIMQQMADRWMNFTEQEDQILELQEDIWANIGKVNAMAPEARAVLQSYGVQAYGLPIPEGNMLAPNGGSLTARGYDPAWAMITQYPQLVKSLNYLKNAIQDTDNPNRDGDLLRIAGDYYKQVQDTMEESPFLIFFDRIADIKQSYKSNAVMQTFLAKVASNFLSPTSLGTLNRMREDVQYKKYNIDEYTADGLSYSDWFELSPDSKLSDNVRKAFLDGKPSLFRAKFQEEGDMYAWEEIEQLMGMGVWDEEKQEYVNTQGMSQEIREEIKVPTSIVPLHRLNRHTPKYPVLTVFGDTIPVGTSLQNLFGIKIVERLLDPKSKLLTEEYMWLMNEKAQASDVFGSPSQSLTVNLLDGGDDEWEIKTAGGSDFRTTLKLDREQEWVREKMIGDLFKEKLHQIVGENKGPLGTAYAKIRKRINSIDEKLSNMDENSDEYKQLNIARRKAVLDINGVWNRTAKSIRHLVDYTIFGEEKHNMKFWAEYMQAYEMDPEGLRLEMESIYPTKTGDEISTIVDAWIDAFHMDPAPSREKNIVFNEVYRAWAKKHNVDREHWNDRQNLRNLTMGLQGAKIPKGFLGIDTDIKNNIKNIFPDSENPYKQDRLYYMTPKGENKKPLLVKRPKRDSGGKKFFGDGKDALTKFQSLEKEEKNIVHDIEFLRKPKEITEKTKGGLPKYPVISKLSEY